MKHRPCSPSFFGKARLRLLRLAAVFSLVCTQSAAAVEFSTELISVGALSDTAGATSYPRSLSGTDGRYLAFTSAAADLIPGLQDYNRGFDAFVFDRESDTISVISTAQGTPNVTGNNASIIVATSPDGRWVLFHSQASNLIAGLSDTNGEWDVFLHDRVAGTTQPVSRASIGFAAANDRSLATALSDDGRFVVYRSEASNLVTGLVGMRGTEHVFLYDSATQTSVLVSRQLGNPTVRANAPAGAVAVSSDGQYILFKTRASDVVGGVVDTNNVDDVFLFDSLAGTSTLVSHALVDASSTANAPTEALSLSGDGRWVLFQSQASDIAAADPNGSGTDVFLWDRDSQASVLISKSADSATTTANGSSLANSASMTVDGRLVAFESLATNLVAGLADSNLSADIFIFDRDNGSVTLASQALGMPGVSANGGSHLVALSGDGRSVLANSSATDLVASLIDNNSSDDPYLIDRLTGSATLIAPLPGTPASTGNDRSTARGLSHDGAVVMLSSLATDLVAGINDGNGAEDILLYQTTSGLSTLVSRASGTPVAVGRNSRVDAVSDDRRWVLFSSAAPNIVSGVVDNNEGQDLFLRDRVLGATQLVTHRWNHPRLTTDSPPSGASISSDGRWVLYQSNASDLVEGFIDNNLTQDDIYLFDRDPGVSMLISNIPGSPQSSADGHSGNAEMSADARWISFASDARNLVTGMVDMNGEGSDVYLRDRLGNRSTLVSHASSSPTIGANGYSYLAAISPDGRRLLLGSWATDLIAGSSDSNTESDVYVHDRVTDSVSLISHAAGSPGAAANGRSTPAAMSSDGCQVLFTSTASDLVSGIVDNRFELDVFIHDCNTGVTRLVSASATNPGTTANAASSALGMSTDGQRIAFISRATDLVEGISDTNNADDIFVLDRASNTVSVVSVSANAVSATANARTTDGSISGDGLWVAFDSMATNLVPNQVDSNGTGIDTFLWDASTGAVSLLSHVAGQPNVTVGQHSTNARITRDGRAVTFSAAAADLVPGVAHADSGPNAFLIERPGSDATSVFEDGFE